MEIAKQKGLELGMSHKGGVGLACLKGGPSASRTNLPVVVKSVAGTVQTSIFSWAAAHCFDVPDVPDSEKSLGAKSLTHSF